jgi:hypothetical protein
VILDEGAASRLQRVEAMRFEVWGGPVRQPESNFRFRCYRTPHLGVDADTHEIVAVELTPDDVGEIAELPDLLDQIDADVASMTADGGVRWPGRL